MMCTIAFTIVPAITFTVAPATMPAGTFAIVS